MVGPAVKREAVAHLQARMGLSERRACRIVGADRKMIRYRSIDRPRRSCGSGCGSWPMNAAGSAIGGCSSCCAGRVSRQGSTGSTGSIARKA